MAKLHALLLVAGLLAVGCNSNRQTAMVDRLPAPNFAGPATPKPVYIAPAPAPAVTPTKPKVAMNSPSDWKPVAPANGWRWIVIHHSATPSGGADRFDKMHRGKGWDELGYHFVIGNGTDTADGQIEVGSRWPKQKWGAHAKTTNNEYNKYGIGICLVGNFDLERPTPKQMQSLAKLTAHLMKTYRIRSRDIVGHGDTKPTDCPGKYLSVTGLRKQAAQVLVDAGEPAEADVAAATASTELMVADGAQ